MKPVDQTVVNDSTGNCFSACLASILELSIDDVPNFMELEKKTVESWFVLAWRWLRERGYRIEVGDFENSDNPEGYWIASGKSYRYPDKHHAVVYLGNKMAHDPHPSRVGLDGGSVFYYVLKKVKEDSDA
jgi:hypothetical protein